MASAPGRADGLRATRVRREGSARNFCFSPCSASTKLESTYRLGSDSQEMTPAADLRTNCESTIQHRSSRERTSCSP